jgi:CheY-like chemotaxis protein
MSKPLALVCYTNLLPGSQIANRLLDLGYSVQTTEPAKLDTAAERDMPILVVTEIPRQADVCGAISRLKAKESTRHIPVLAFSGATELAQARAAGASLVASSDAILGQLPHLLEQVLAVE